jgi:plasmid maintenance system antidote protein VapI
MVSMAILNDLRAAVAKDGRSHAAICRECGIHPKTFSTFIHGRRGLSIETAENLAVALRFTLRLVKVRGENKPKAR